MPAHSVRVSSATNDTITPIGRFVNAGDASSAHFAVVFANLSDNVGRFPAKRTPCPGENPISAIRQKDESTVRNRYFATVCSAFGPGVATKFNSDLPSAGFHIRTSPL